MHRKSLYSCKVAEAILVLCLPSFTKKRVSSIKKKNEQHHWILHIRITLSTKFQLKLRILIIWTKFTQKGWSRSKALKMNTTLELYIFELVFIWNFSLNLQFWLFGLIFPKRRNPSQKRKKWKPPLNSAYLN